MTNPYELRLLAQAREEELQRMFAGRHGVRRQRHLLRDIRSAFSSRRRARDAQAQLRVLPSPWGPSTRGPQSSLGFPTTYRYWH